MDQNTIARERNTVLPSGFYKKNIKISRLYQKSIKIVENKRPDGLYSSAQTLQKFANKIIWGGLIYKTVRENKYTLLLIELEQRFLYEPFRIHKLFQNQATST